MKVQTLLAATALLISGCHSIWEDPDAYLPLSAPASLSQGHWQLTHIGEQAQTNSLMQIQLVEETQILGHTGCNRFFGKLRIEHEQLYVDELGMTKMLCSDEHNEQEHMLLNMLRIGVPFDSTNEYLLLKGRPQLRFERVQSLAQ